MKKTSSKASLSCILHVGAGKPEEQVKTFDDRTWQKVINVAEIRRQILGPSKYSDVVNSLPKALKSEEHGYHSTCYKSFTAVSASVTSASLTKSVTDDPGTKSTKTLLRSDVGHLITATSGVFEQKCLFCKSITKYRKRKREELGTCETIEAENSIRNAAKSLCDREMLAKIEHVDFVAKEVRYHHSCRKEYLSKADKVSSKSIVSDYAVERHAHAKAYDEYKKYIDEYLVQKKGAELLTHLHSRYLKVFSKFTDSTDDPTYAAQSLASKLLKDYAGILQMETLSRKQGTIVYHCSLSKNEAIYKACPDVNHVSDAALYIRSEILKIQSECKELPYPITDEALKEGQAQPPLSLLQFFRVLYTGSMDESGNDAIERLVQSSADDALYATTRGHVKPGKHLLMGVGLKSMTGKRQVVEILNRFGHSISYHMAETIETELATKISEKSSALPDGLLQESGLSTGTAWDNYDENIETLSGANTVHDTVGICYQNVCQETRDTGEDDANSENEAVEDRSLEPRDTTGDGTASSSEATKTISPKRAPLQKRSKRAFGAKEAVLEPYRKKPKMTVFKYEMNTAPLPTNLLTMKQRDILWMMCTFFCKVPMWTGWNSLVTEPNLLRQNIAYMENICAPPTQLDVVAETLKISQRVAQECGERYAVVTYDLAIAKPAMQMQAQETPLYDNMFICFGAFHITLAYFGSLGYILDGSGGPEILIESELLATGSLNGFILGKHYNRCKRLHVMLSTAFRIVHFQSYLESSGPISEELKQHIQLFTSNLSPVELHHIEDSHEFRKLMENYIDYCERTKQGHHGQTAKFWITYMELVDVFLRFSRAYKTNDVDLYVHSLGEMRDVFFATNRPNYSRWMVLYYLNLTNIEVSHPGLKKELENGALSIQRTTKPFSRTPVDQALEQTINADAASRLTGISAFIQSNTARRRWMLTRAARSKIVGNLLSKAGFKETEDASKEVRPHRIQKDNDDLQRLIHGIKSTMNPFHEAARDENLYCLSNGSAVSDEVKTELLNIRESGETWREEFQAGCCEDPCRFEKPIKRRKVKNFASAAVKAKIQTKDRKVKELQGTRDLFGRLLFLSTVKQLDLSKVFSYPLTPVPLSLAHVDGTINKTDKSKLFKKIETRLDSQSPSETDALVVDAMFLLHTLKNIPPSYGGIAKMLLEKLCVHERTDFVCDTYTRPSIKDIERERRGRDESHVAITGPQQKKPKDFQKALQSSKFKTSFLQFLAMEWQDQKYRDILNGHRIFMGTEDKCFRFTVHNEKVTRQEVPELECSHEEADTRIAFHIKHIHCEQPRANITVRTNDTDVCLILLYHAPTFGDAKIWVDAGLSGNNTRRFIDVTTMATQLGPQLCDAVLGLHAFTGTDYTASFMGKGKVRPLDIMEKSPVYTAAFGRLGSSQDVCEDSLPCIEEYICALYGKPKIKTVDEARFVIFQQNYAPKNLSEPMEKIKGANPSSFPPCRPVLRNKWKRAHYVTSIWRNALLPDPQVFLPTDYGWVLRDNAYQINWFDGHELPQSICDVLDTVSSSGEETDDDNDDCNPDIYGSDEDDDDGSFD